MNKWSLRAGLLMQATQKLYLLHSIFNVCYLADAVFKALVFHQSNLSSIQALASEMVQNHLRLVFVCSF